MDHFLKSLYEDDGFLSWLSIESTSTTASPTTQLATTATKATTSTPQPADLQGDTGFSQLTIGQLCNVANIFFPRPTATSSAELSERDLAVNVIYYICMPVSQSSDFGVNESPLRLFDASNDDLPATTPTPVATTLSPRWQALLGALSSVKETSRENDENEEEDTGEETEPSPDTEQAQDAMETDEQVVETRMPPTGGETIPKQDERNPDYTEEKLLKLLLRQGRFGWNQPNLSPPIFKICEFYFLMRILIRIVDYAPQCIV